MVIHQLQVHIDLNDLLVQLPVELGPPRTLPNTS